MYWCDWNKFVKLLLPTFLRKPVILALLRSCVKPVKTIHTEFLELKKEWDYRLNHDGRVFSLEKVLNDKFDAVERRIYITDTDFQDDVYVGNVDNRDQVYISNGIDTIYIGSAPQYYAQADFIVHVPWHILFLREIDIRSTVVTYKIAGKTYIIVEI